MTSSAKQLAGGSLKLCGERFTVVYHFGGTAQQARAMAEDLCIEQTVEFPSDLLPDGAVRDQIVGQIESLETATNGHQATISFAVETVGSELTQLLNVLFGNSSIKPGIKALRLEALPPSLARCFPGPRFGRQGLRRLLGAPTRPLLCTALKPMGLDPVALATLAERCALGGVDLIKDDHGLADQPFCPFDERVARCAEAVARANAHTGGRSIYVANVSAPADQLGDRLRRADEVGVGGLLVAPGLVGFDAMRWIATARPALPVICHPALLGSYVVHPDHGLSPGLLFGQLVRLAGGDATIFPHHGGRFAFSEEDCRDLAAATEVAMGPRIDPILPVPAGGIGVDRVPQLRDFYGDELILLIGGDLHRGDLIANCQRFRKLVEDPVV